MVLSNSKNNDEQTAAKLLWQLKAIATKEVEKISLPYSCIDSFYIDPMISSEGRGRTISIESVDIAVNTASPVLAYIPKTYVENKSPLVMGSSGEKSSDHLDHHDWGPTDQKLSLRPLISTGEGTRQSKRKRESHVGLTTKSGIIRCTLRKKFSWKQYPELEDYLLQNQEEYFEYSSRNYTAEQRKYNNALTRGLLDLASSEGYVFEEFTFSMVRDRIRCYYKSHSQSAKKKRRS
mmetsp:Transcript_21873/g.52044  ORF Transcript_21873/g.52044 Transcript_21873/m.52044 type:complete len:235 (-) Transcript_21873:4423-5127(-)